MVSTATTKVPLGPTTTNRKWYLDIDSSGGAATPTYIGVFGITQFQSQVAASLQDDSDFDGAGWGSQTNSRNAWSIVLKAKRGVKKGSTPKVYDPGQEILRVAGAATGVANTVRVRWYEMEPNGPRVEAYEGYAAVSYSEDGGGTEALSMVSVTLTGQGARGIITHPDAA